MTARPAERYPWRFWASKLEAMGLRLLLAGFLLISVSVQTATADAHTAQATLLRNREFAEALLEGVRSARKSIYFSFFLFKTTDARGNLPRQIAEGLLSASRRGVEVVVILERQAGDIKGAGRDSLNADNRRTAALLRQGGIKVFFDSPGVTTHTKVAVIDGRRVFLGSHNLSQSALRHNNELSIMLESAELAAEIKEYLDRL